jgi:hypothetical protein
VSTTDGSYGPYPEDNAQETAVTRAFTHRLRAEAHQRYGGPEEIGEFDRYHASDLTTHTAEGLTTGHERDDAWGWEWDTGPYHITLDRDIFEYEDPPATPIDPPPITIGPMSGAAPQAEPGEPTPSTPRWILLPAPSLDFEVSEGPLPSDRPINRLDEILRKEERGERLNGLEIALLPKLAAGAEGAELLRKDPIKALRLAQLLPSGTGIGWSPSGRGPMLGDPPIGIDQLQTGLDVAGLTPDPIVGPGADFINGLIHAARGDLTNAGLSFFSMIPLVGDAAAKGGKAAKFAIDVKAAKPVAVVVSKIGKK